MTILKTQKERSKALPQAKTIQKDSYFSLQTQYLVMVPRFYRYVNIQIYLFFVKIYLFLLLTFYKNCYILFKNKYSHKVSVMP